MLARQLLFEAGLRVHQAIENELTEIKEAKKHYKGLSTQF